MSRRIDARYAAAAVVVCGLIVAGAVGAGEDVVGAPASSPGMKAYVDPQTGKLLPGRPASLPPEPTSPALDRSATGLVEVPAPGGGRMIDLQGRFQSPLVATIAPDGTLRIHHTDE